MVAILHRHYVILHRPDSPPPVAGWRDTRRRAAGPGRCPRHTPPGWRWPGWRRTCPACRTWSPSGSQHPPWHRQSEPPGHSGISTRNTGAGSRENILSNKKIFYPHNKTFFAYHLAQGNFQGSFSPSRRFEIFIIDRVSSFPVILLLNVVSPLFVEKYFLQSKCKSDRLEVKFTITSGDRYGDRGKERPTKFPWLSFTCGPPFCFINCKIVQFGYTKVANTNLTVCNIILPSSPFPFEV